MRGGRRLLAWASVALLFWLSPETAMAATDPLARLLPDAHREYPADAYSEVVRFVLYRGRLESPQREPLERALGAALARAEENDDG